MQLFVQIQTKKTNLSGYLWYSKTKQLQETMAENANNFFPNPTHPFSYPETFRKLHEDA